MKYIKLYCTILFISFSQLLLASPFSISNILSTQAALPFLSVTNQNNVTNIWVKTYSNQKILLWKHSPMLSNDEYNFDFNTDKQGDYFSLNVSDIRPPPPFTTFVKIVNLQNGLVAQPSPAFLTYTSDGIGLYSDAQNQKILLLKPIFSPCANPTVVNLDKNYLVKGSYVDPVFEDNTHLNVNYTDQGGLMNPGKFTVNPSKIVEQCTNKDKTQTQTNLHRDVGRMHNLL